MCDIYFCIMVMKTHSEIGQNDFLEQNQTQEERERESSFSLRWITTLTCFEFDEDGDEQRFTLNTP